MRPSETRESLALSAFSDGLCTAFPLPDAGSGSILTDAYVQGVDDGVRAGGFGQFA